MQTHSTRRATNSQQHNFAGRHLLASYFGCGEELIMNAEHCLTSLRKAAAAAGVTVVSENVHRFPNGGITAFLLLAESHASIHTYPEHNSCFVDFFTCGAGDIDAFDSHLRQELKPSRCTMEVVERGEVSKNSL